MTIANVGEAIRQVRKQLDKYPPEPDMFGYVYRELATRYLLIDPAVRGLDWDMGDFWQCAVEWPMPKDQWSEKADYVLFNRPERGNRPVVVIEAKKCGTDLGKWEAQLQRYVSDLNSGMGVLTDGVIWHLYNLRKRGEFASKRVVTVNIREGTICGENGTSRKARIREMAQTLNAWLDKDRWW